MRNGRTERCPKCGNRVCVITWGIFRRTLVDADAVMVVADAGGEDYVRVDGSKVKARQVGYFEEITGAEPAYRMHRKTCEVST